MNDQNQSPSKSDLLANFLAEREVPAVFELSGGMIAFLTDAIARLGKTPIISTRHEQAAGFAAEGATRFTGRSAVAMATSGPGATNLITAIASSYFDSVPTVFITGQVNQSELKKNAFQRQNGFQELDIVQAVRGITKYAIMINSKSNLLEELNKAWRIAHEGRPGPVLLDIPIDVQQELAPISFAEEHLGGEFLNENKREFRIRELLALIENSERPIFLLGGGIRSSRTTELLREIIDEWKIPAVHSLMGVDVLESSSPYRIGMIGSYGNRWANRALAKADLIIALGTRLDIRQTGPDPTEFVRGKKVFRVDVDVYELDGRIKADLSVESDLTSFISALSKIKFQVSRSEWLTSIHQEQQLFPQRAEQPADVEFNPEDIMNWLSSLSSQINGYIVDVGQHQMWAAQSLKLSGDQRFITSGGLGSMGFALPAAIGATAAAPGRWIVIAGDGCAQLSIAELQTISQLNSPITLCILNNNQHGMVAQFQESNMDSRFTATRDGYSAPNFCKVAESFGITSRLIKDNQDLLKLNDFVSTWNSGPLVLEFNISLSAKALPKLGTGTSIQDL
jgi:acetolactate synthase I/II/III large subunit